MTKNELKTTAKQLRRLSTYEVRLRAAQARQAGDQTLATAALGELKQRGR